MLTNYFKFLGFLTYAKNAQSNCYRMLRVRLNFAIACLRIRYLFVAACLENAKKANHMLILPIQQKQVKT